MADERSSTVSAVRSAQFGLRIIRAVQPSAARGEAGDCMAKDSSADYPDCASAPSLINGDDGWSLNDGQKKRPALNVREAGPEAEKG